MKNYLISLIFISAFFSANAQWQQLNGPNSTHVTCFASNSQYIFAATLNGIYRSADNGATWNHLNSGLVNDMSYFIAVQGSHVFCIDYYNKGLLTSSDNGDTWSVGSVTYLYSIAANDQFLYAITDEGIIRSSDFGVTWNLTYGVTGITRCNISLGGSKVFVPLYDGYLSSEDNGNTFEYIDLSGQYMEVYSFLIKPNYLLAISSNGRVYRSLDGYDWNMVFSNNSTYSTSEIVSDNNFVYVGFVKASSPVSGGVYRSADEGIHWTLCGKDSVSVSQLHCAGNKIFEALNYDGIYTSSDNGNTWQRSSDGIYLPCVYSFDVEGNNMLAATRNLYYSQNQGSSWEVKIANTQYDFTGVTFIYNTILFYGGYQILRSLDNGVTWESFSVSPYSISCFTNAGTRILAGGFSGLEVGGIYYSDDFGTTWHPYNPGFHAGIFCMKNINGKIYYGTSSGLYVGDGFTQWVKIDDVPSIPVYTIAGDSSGILVSGNNWYFPNYYSEIFYSGDNGVSWTRRKFDCSGIISSMEKQGQYYLMGITGWENSVLISDDEGLTWSDAGKGLSEGVQISCLKISGNDAYFSCGQANGLSAQILHGIYKRPLSEFIPFKAADDTVVLAYSAGSSFSLAIASENKWEIERPLPPWFTVSNFSGNGSGQVNIIAAQTNPYEPPCYFTMEITSEGFTREVVVQQDGRILGLAETGDGNNLVYPNPTHGTVTIGTAGNYEKITVSNAYGKIMGVYATSSIKGPIDLSSFGKGVYYLHLTGQKGNSTSKVIVY